MKVINVLLPSSHELIPCGDKHLGTTLSYTDGVEELYDYILKRKNRYHIDLGDRIEAITVDDKRFAVESDGKVPVPLQQALEALRQDKRIAKRLICMLIGNHELKLRKFGNLTEFMAAELSKVKGSEVSYGTYTAVIRVSDEFGLLYNLFISHGFGSFNSKAKDYEQFQGNRRAGLKNKLRFKAGDCAIMAMGHTHQLFITPPTNQLYLTYGQGKPAQHYLEWNGNNKNYIDPDNRWYVSAGSFLKLYGDGIGYGEVAGYNPVETGYPIIQVVDRKIVGIKKVVV
jgi:hypothetical protein